MLQAVYRLPLDGLGRSLRPERLYHRLTRRGWLRRLMLPQ